MRYREITEAAASKLYHFTPAKSLKSIKTHGLDPNFRQTNSPILHTHGVGGKMIYLAIDAHHAANYIHYQEVSQGLILSVPVSALDPKQLLPDDVDLADILGSNSRKEWYEHTWRESLKKCGQCCYGGVIPAAVLTVIGTVDYTGEIKPYQTPLASFSFDRKNVTEEAKRLAIPSKRALKFWITNKGRLEVMDQGEHHYDFILNRDMGWHTPFQEGWVRGFYEKERDLISFDFDERRVRAPVCRTMMKMVTDYNPSTIIVDDTQGGAFHGSQRLDPAQFKTFVRSLAAG